MLKETIIDQVLYNVKKLIPKSVFNYFQPAYHILLAYAGALLYGFPSGKLKVIGITGTKGKSTVAHLLTKILEQGGKKVGACSSLGFKIGEKEWPNTLKMTMPGRFRLHKLMAEAVRAGCEYFILEVTSEGIKQKRHLGINFDCAVFTNLHKEHIESHGSFENYYKAGAF
jgi:UDP-N-acetylmuramoyl-L-alanyl-D-glutamate--2,6-diaminopimelate ligase